MFDFSFGELLMVLLVAMVVLGPKELPRYLRKAGQWAGRLRRIAYEMRQKSGIDEVLRTEGIDRDIAEIRKLTRGEITGIVAAVRARTTDAVMSTAPASAPSPAVPSSPAPSSPMPSLPAPSPPVETKPAALLVHREREYPRDGADAYGALPDTAAVYEGSLAPSALASDPLYAQGEGPVGLGSLPARSEDHAAAASGSEP